MGVKEIQPGLHQVSLPGVNAFLLDSNSDGLTLVDTGVPGSEGKIRAAVQSLGRQMTDVRQILVTHCHPDHSGSLAELKRETSAGVFMHRRDAMLVASGRAMRRLIPSPGVLNALLFRMIIAPKPTTVEPSKADVLLSDGDEIPVAGGISVIHAPGHTEGHLVFLVQNRGVAFIGDAASNILGLRLMIGYEHLQQGVMSLRKLCRYEFETACFGHGPPILRGAASRFRERWGQLSAARRRGSSYDLPLLDRGARGGKPLRAIRRRNQR